jgi:hypothetical protein
MPGSNIPLPEGHAPVLIYRRKASAAGTRNIIKSVLYTLLPNMRLHTAAANEVEIEDILSDNGQDEEEIFRTSRPLF